LRTCAGSSPEGIVVLQVKTSPAPELREAGPADIAGILSLLEGGGLPTADIASSRPDFIIACEGPEVVGAGAFQAFEQCALLRSVVVSPALRGTGVGKMIVARLEERIAARSRGATQVVLLTQTATDFFQHLGYRVIERANAPAALHATEEFRTLCPSSAVCMIKTVGSAQ
jgi:amino-acid N-acetyltransferase